MIKRETQFTVLFRHWLKANPMLSGAFELKFSLSNAFAFDSVKQHQIDALIAVRSDKGFLYKAPDDSRGIKPFDLFYLRNAPSYIVIKYLKFFCIITTPRFVLEKEESKRKSLTSERAKEISFITVAS